MNMIQNMIQNSNGILINEDHYIQSLELPDMEVARDLQCDDILDADGQKEFRGCVAKLLYVGFQSRPDVCFEGKCLSSKFGKAKERFEISIQKDTKIERRTDSHVFS